MNETQADMPLQRVAVGAAGGLAHVVAVAVDGLPPPWPEVQVCIVVFKDEHGEALVNAFLLLTHQRLSPNEVGVLQRDSESDWWGREGL